MFKEQIDYDAIWIDRPFDRKILEEIVSIAVDVLTSTAKTIRINREDKPAQIVKGIYRKIRSEEHTSGLQSRFDLVCRLLLETTNIAGNHVGAHCEAKQRIESAYNSGVALSLGCRLVAAAEGKSRHV